MLVGTFNSGEGNNTPMKSIRSYSVGKEMKGGDAGNFFFFNIRIITLIKINKISKNKIYKYIN